ncbi:MAG: hypothetical protein J6Z33_08215 [Lachnospiraceae bacterium]|nr:hypothetical protein [Lachnospiraceae bacterium]
MEENRKELEAAKIEDWDQDVVGGTSRIIKGRPGANSYDDKANRTESVKNCYNTGMVELEDSCHGLNTALGVDPTNAFPGGASSRYETG